MGKMIGKPLSSMGKARGSPAPSTGVRDRGGIDNFQKVIRKTAQGDERKEKKKRGKWFEKGVTFFGVAG